jgi:RNA polymerase sigma-70 factor (ECF subfamily)
MAHCSRVCGGNPDRVPRGQIDRSATLVPLRCNPQESQRKRRRRGFFSGMNQSEETPSGLARGDGVPDGSASSASLPAGSPDGAWGSPSAQPAARSRAEHEATLRAAWAEHRAGLFRLGLRYGGGRRALAEDVVQETFLKLWNHLDRLEDVDDVGGWLYRVCTNECLSRLRRESFRNSPIVTLLLGTPTTQAPSADVLAVLGADRTEALAALAVLSPKERVAFCMVHLDGKTLREVGAVLGHTAGAVHKILDRANERLRKAGWRTDTAPKPSGDPS